MRLNIGCNTLTLPVERWTNVDLVKSTPDVVVLDVRQGLPYGDESVDEIYMGNTFDHFGFFEGIKLLYECRRVLKSGGFVKMSLMDTDKIINAYLYDKMDQFAKIQPAEYSQMREKSLKFTVFLLGNMARQEDYTGHCMLYTPASIQEVGEKCGFQVKFEIEPDRTIEPWCIENKEFSNHVFYVNLVKQ